MSADAYGARLVKRTGADAMSTIHWGWNVVTDAGYVFGFVYQSDRRWMGGWVAVTADGKDLGDQPRRGDAVMVLEAYVTSPFRDSPK